jgi:hypothetical protein
VLHAVLAGALLATAACGRPSAAGSESNPVMRLVTPANGGPAYVEVTGLSGRALDDLEDAEYTTSEWSALLRVSVSESDDEPAVLGAYRTSGDALHFTPAFPFDPGRAYHARLDAARLPGAPADAAPVALEFGLPATAGAPSTVVERIYPSGPDVPENLLRMYVEFTAPMGRRSGVDYIALLDHEGREIEGAVLPLDYEFWSPDHRRFTVFFDPGRVKQGILPNRELGRPLEAGTTITLVVSPDWRDAQGLPLADEYRRVFQVGPAAEQPLDPSAWRIRSARAGSRDALVVSFPAPLDHGLLMRALGVRRDGGSVVGESAVDAAETRWTFTPRDAWRAGRYELLALDILEDLAGNQIGRAFEVDNFDTVDRTPEPRTIETPFRID